MSFTKETYSTETYTETHSGYGIFGYTTSLLGSDTTHDGYGGVILTDESYTTTTYTGESYS